MCLRERGWEGVDWIRGWEGVYWIHLAEDGDKWWVLVLTVV